MFGDSMLETSWPQRSRRSWMTLASFGIQALITGILLLLPLIRPEGLLVYHRLSTPISLGKALQPSEVHSDTPELQSNFANHRLMMPSRIPTVVMRVSDDPLPRDFEAAGPYVPGTPGQGAPDGLLNFGGSGTRPILQPLSLAASHPTRVSNMNEGSLVLRVQPEYPPLAKIGHIQGQVVLSAIISKEGTIENLRVLSGHPMLEVETQITVNFSLTGN